jgi:hypothetical protein
MSKLHPGPMSTWTDSSHSFMAPLQNARWSWVYSTSRFALFAATIETSSGSDASAATISGGTGRGGGFGSATALGTRPGPGGRPRRVFEPHGALGLPSRLRVGGFTDGRSGAVSEGSVETVSSSSASFSESAIRYPTSSCS